MFIEIKIKEQYKSKELQLVKDRIVNEYFSVSSILRVAPHPDTEECSIVILINGAVEAQEPYRDIVQRLVGLANA